MILELYFHDKQKEQRYNFKFLFFRSLNNYLMWSLILDVFVEADNDLLEAYLNILSEENKELLDVEVYCAHHTIKYKS